MDAEELSRTEAHVDELDAKNAVTGEFPLSDAYVQF